MAPKEKQTIEIEKTHGDPLLPFNQAVTVDCSDFLGTALSTLRKAIEAMGGKLEIHAKFPAGEVRIRQFGGLARKRRSRSRGGDAGRRAKAAA